MVKALLAKLFLSLDVKYGNKDYKDKKDENEDLY